MSYFVLVHGAWHAAWTWSRITPLLQASSHATVVLNLPGHGGDPTPKATLTLQTYADYVASIVRAQPEPAILVGHSMGGMVISRVGEMLPRSIACLAYVAGFLPKDGESLRTYASQDRESLIESSLRPADDGTVIIAEEAAKAVFYAACDAGDARAAISRLEPQPVRPLQEPVLLTERNFGSVPKAYIVCSQDRAISLPVQRSMASNWPLIYRAELDTDHSPFLSQPHQLARELLEVAGRAAAT